MPVRTWPATPQTEVEDAEGLDAAFEAFRRGGGTALGLHLDTIDARGRASSDPRSGTLHAVAVAFPAEPADARSVHTFRATPALMRALARQLNTTPAPYVVCFHAQSVLRFLRTWGIDFARPGCVTTMQALLSEGLSARPRSIEDAVLEVFQRELIPPMASTAQALARQADALVPLAKRLTPRLRRLGLAQLYELECGLLDAVVDMEGTGIAFDETAFEQLASAWTQERGTTTEPSRITRLDKLLSTYAHWGRSWVGEDGRIRCLLHPLATDSGRFSCTDPNLQQVPSTHTAPGFRRCFVPAEGHVLVVADYSQIELRVAAQLAPCSALTAVFEADRDPHRATAATLTGKAESQISQHERKLAKAINFGFLFGMGARRFQSYAASSYGLDLDETQARQAREAFFSTFPGIAKWHERTGELGRRAQRRDVVVTTASGRRKRFEAGHFSFPAALNIPVQGTAAEGFKHAMGELYARLPEVGGRGVLTVHDEYLAEVPVAQAEAAKTLVETCMIEGMRRVVDRVPIRVEAEICRNWED